MISSAVSAIVDELNQFLKIRFRLDEDRVILSNLVGPDGNSSLKEMNKVVVSVVNIQEEKLGKPKNNSVVSIGSKPPVFLNIFILFTSVFDEKLNKESLKFISAVVSFFQNKKLFTPGDTPQLDSSIEKIVMDIYNLDFKDQSSMFSTLGAKYSPCIMYKMRMVAIDEGTMDYTPGVISERGTDTSSE